MTVKQLKKLLENIDDNRIVVLQIDSEGNGYNKCRGVDDNALYDAETHKVGMERIDEDGPYTEEDLGKGKKAVVIFP